MPLFSGVEENVPARFFSSGGLDRAPSRLNDLAFVIKSGSDSSGVDVGSGNGIGGRGGSGGSGGDSSAKLLAGVTSNGALLGRLCAVFQPANGALSALVGRPLPSAWLCL